MVKEDKILELLDRFKDDLIMLDALYQWARTPTSPTAVKNGCPPNHGLIKKNIARRYDLDSKEVEKTYNKLVKEIENLGIDFVTGYLDFPNADADENELAMRINEEYGEGFRKEVLQRLNSASQEEKYIAWLFCKVRDNYYLFPHDNDPYFHDARNNFITLFNTAFDFTTKGAIIDPLIRIGFINKLEWNHSRCTKSSDMYIFPNYLKPLALEIDKYTVLPELPDYKKYINTIFDRRVVDALVFLDELLNKGYLSEINRIHGKIITSPIHHWKKW